MGLACTDDQRYIDGAGGPGRLWARGRQTRIHVYAGSMHQTGGAVLLAGSQERPEVLPYLYYFYVLYVYVRNTALDTTSAREVPMCWAAPMSSRARRSVAARGGRSWRGCRLDRGSRSRMTKIWHGGDNRDVTGRASASTPAHGVGRRRSGQRSYSLQR